MSDCIEWTQCKNDRGYGYTRRRGKTAYAHRVAYEEAFGEIPEGLFVLHKCDNPSCVNPEHLFLGTNADNMRDKMSKGRHRSPRGEQTGTSKLTEDEILSIREMYHSGNYSQKQIGVLFGVSDSNIHYITSRKSWSHI